MNRFVKTLIVAIAIIAINGCAKEIDFSAAPNNKNCNLTVLQTDLGVLGNLEIKFIYNTEGKLIKAVNGTDFTDYSYVTNKITAVDQDGDVGEINLTNGRATNSKYTYTGSSDNETKIYTYNAEGYIVLVKSYANGVLDLTSELSYTNGNLTQSKTTYEVDGSIEITKHEYTGNVAKTVYELFDPLSNYVDYFPGNYFGKVSKNILAKTSSIYSASNGVKLRDDVITYTYQFNSSGYSTTTTLSQLMNYYHADGSVSSSDTYATNFNSTYSCK